MIWKTYRCKSFARKWIAFFDVSLRRRNEFPPGLCQATRAALVASILATHSAGLNRHLPLWRRRMHLQLRDEGALALECRIVASVQPALIRCEA